MPLKTEAPIDHVPEPGERRVLGLARRAVPGPEPRRRAARRRRLTRNAGLAEPSTPEDIDYGRHAPSRRPRARAIPGLRCEEPEPEPETGDRVTEPDPVAALAAQLEELRGQLARYTGETGHLRAKLAEDSGQVVMLRLEIKHLGEKIEEAIARRNAEEPPAPYWLGLSREEHGTRLAELREWVDRVGLVHYPGYFEKLPPLLGQSPGGGLGALQRSCRVDPGLWRRGQPGPGRRALVARPVASRCPVPPGRGRQVRRGRLPAAEAVGAIAAALP